MVMPSKIKRFFECYVPVTACNFRCEYCYIIQASRNKGEMPKFAYSPEHIGKALTTERLGGICYFSICGGGETLLPKEVVTIIYELLKNGHYVNVTTNGTHTKAFDRICEVIPKEMLKRLHFAFSLHYNELMRLDLLGVFSSNVKKMRDAGCSILVQMNLYDGYLSHLEEIKNYCIDNFGAMPQVAATRLEADSYRLHTRHAECEYKSHGEEFQSPLFDFTMRNFNVSRKGNFCYAGEWSALINLATGVMNPCYSCGRSQNIFEDISRPIDFRPVGYDCRLCFCVNSSHFLSLGVIPSLYKEITYAGLRNRKAANWYSSEMEAFLGGKLNENNKEFSPIQLQYKRVLWWGLRLKRFLKSIARKMYDFIRKN